SDLRASHNNPSWYAGLCFMKYWSGLEACGIRLPLPGSVGSSEAEANKGSSALVFSDAGVVRSEGRSLFFLLFRLFFASFRACLRFLLISFLRCSCSFSRCLYAFLEFRRRLLSSSACRASSLGAMGSKLLTR